MEDAKEELAEVFHKCFTYQRPSMDWKQALDTFCTKWLSAAPPASAVQGVALKPLSPEKVRELADRAGMNFAKRDEVTDPVLEFARLLTEELQKGAQP